MTKGKQRTLERKARRKEKLVATLADKAERSDPIIRCACFELSRRSASHVFAMSNPPNELIHEGVIYRRDKSPLAGSGLLIYREVGRCSDD